MNKKTILLVLIGIIVAGSIGGALLSSDDTEMMDDTMMDDTEMMDDTMMDDTEMMDDTMMDDTEMMDDSLTTEGIPEVVNIGLLLPATGDIASHGEDNIIASRLGAADFNEHLRDTGEPWQINLINEDTQTDPIVALEKLQSLNSKGVKLIFGTETSAELLSVKSYAEDNNMLLISPSSTSPKLAIEDNIYRLIPDDTKQGLVLAELLNFNGVKVVVPIYRGDVWGDGLYESTRTSFEELGGTIDDGIRYNPEITVFSTEASLLSNTVDKYLEEYTIDEVAVLAIGFSEMVHLLNSANSYDTLHSISWYGSDGSANDDAITEDRISSEFASDVTFVAAQFSASKNDKYERVRDHLIETIGSPPNAYAYSSYDSVWLLGLTILEKQTLDANILGDSLSETAKDYTGAIGQIEFNAAGDLAIADYELFTVLDGEWISYGYYDSALNSITIY